MKRLIIAAAAVSVLAVVTAVGVFAQTPPAAQGQGWSCPGWGAGAQGNNDPSTNPTIKALADKLGIQASDLVSQLQGGKSVADVAKDKGVSEQTLIDLLQAPMVDMMKVRVQYGYLTQDQADQAQKYMAERIKTQLEQKGFVGGYGMMGGGMMGRGFGGGMMGPGGQGMMGRGGQGGPGMMGGGYGPRGGARTQGYSY
jgi:hypothetical protein